MTLFGPLDVSTSFGNPPDLDPPSHWADFGECVCLPEIIEPEREKLAVGIADSVSYRNGSPAVSVVPAHVKSIEEIITIAFARGREAEARYGGAIGLSKAVL